MTKKEPAGCAWRANASASTGPRGGSLRFGLVGKVQRARNGVFELFFLSCCFSASAIDVPWPVITSTWRSFAQKSHNLHLDHFAVAALALISG